ncbi:uncharacterized protein PHACADRAFT_248735 [Phanerochaete carnosa HHB-10118-sp]|uniref:Uncharacterized protein n=1 Tax=Phanerochaete carnosa (strain HHB-10118-sp) TaxID=650164 RepID=K5WD37_PHACS|nr:uncharacterized protein PHACADRAFT_248735 [Phanerochaete carnosa HHB-10118-sp]EKM61848.1 hypothetical protein PHACADRAFT_248735 [Phanerochaete carnosa HHB-10118-sp]
MYALLVGRGSEVEAGMSHINYDRPIPPSLIHSQLELEFGVTIDTTPLSVSDLHRLCTDATSEELAYIDRALDKSIDRPAKERLELKEFLKSNSPTPYLISC